MTLGKLQADLAFAGTTKTVNDETSLKGKYLAVAWFQSLLELAYYLFPAYEETIRLSRDRPKPFRAIIG